MSDYKAHKLPAHKYFYAGRVERPGKRGYHWVEAYSLNGNTFPWLTRTEARAQAKAEGAVAVFLGRDA